ncbi:MAG: alpha/beta fold hydrolase, partial [Erysipelotrichaceae bacterium]|nr:alpha/beta fold hydrolase [Erysipelotrichaceae bacterium]
MAFTELQGIKCYYEKSGSGKPVVLLHGWGQNTEMMKAIALFLENHFTVYNLDLPGFGQSSEPLTPYGVEDYA